MEAWCRIEKYGDRYEVSDQGYVRNRLTRRPMSRNPNGRGYFTIALTVGGVMRRRTVHSLVAEHFIGARPKGLEVNHKNGDKSDNRVENLEYVTRSENMAHAKAASLLRSPSPGPRPPKSWDTREAIKGARKLSDAEIDRVKEMITAKVPQRAIAAEFGVSQMAIWKIAKGTLYKFKE